jgi:hypothetical protein
MFMVSPFDQFPNQRIQATGKPAPDASCSTSEKDMMTRWKWIVAFIVSLVPYPVMGILALVSNPHIWLGAVCVYALVCYFGTIAIEREHFGRKLGRIAWVGLVCGGMLFAAAGLTLAWIAL